MEFGSELGTASVVFGMPCDVGSSARSNSA
jgi:hypothetical protein